MLHTDVFSTPYPLAQEENNAEAGPSRLDEDSTAVRHSDDEDAVAEVSRALSNDIPTPEGVALSGGPDLPMTDPQSPVAQGKCASYS